jgi:hypothetical protein
MNTACYSKTLAVIEVAPILILSSLVGEYLINVILLMKIT